MAEAFTIAGKVQPEPVYYYITKEWYKGNQPCFYNEEDFPGTKILKDNYATIRQEILDFYQEKGDSIKVNFTPYGYKEEGWRTINLYSYFLRYSEHCKAFPKTDEIVRQIPGMCLAQVAVLKPHTRIKPHLGDTNAIARSHLGIRIPGKFPDLGLQIRNEGRGWQEGEVFTFCIVHRHLAWNYTNDYRIILMVDVIKDEYLHQKYKIAGNTLAVIAMKYLATKFPVLKKMPEPLTRAIHPAIGYLFRFRLFLQRTFGI